MALVGRPRGPRSFTFFENDTEIGEADQIEGFDAVAEQRGIEMIVLGMDDGVRAFAESLRPRSRPNSEGQFVDVSRAEKASFEIRDNKRAKRLRIATGAWVHNLNGGAAQFKNCKRDGELEDDD